MILKDCAPSDAGSKFLCVVLMGTVKKNLKKGCAFKDH